VVAIVKSQQDVSIQQPC